MKLSLVPFTVEVSDDLVVGGKAILTVGVVLTSINLTTSVQPDGTTAVEKTATAQPDEDNPARVE